MYKRKPRILFQAVQPGRALLAYALARRLGGNSLEARACYSDKLLQPWWEHSLRVLDLPNQSEPVNEAWLDWADLLVTLDAESSRNLAALPATTRHKHWPLAQAPAAARQQLNQRIQGMLGGIRLLNRPQAAVTIL